ncbi:hypothetical protein LPJ81_006842, partial [Coemansia sp. IMI 209127]
MPAPDSQHYAGSTASDSSPSTPLLGHIHVAEEEASQETADYSSARDQILQWNQYASATNADAIELLDFHSIKAEAVGLVLSALPIVVST